MYKNSITQELVNNIEKLSNSLSSLKIDSIFVEQNKKIDKIFFTDENLHELRSCSKLLVSMAVGIAIDKKMLINGEPLNLNTRVYPILKNLANINTDNISKIKQWTIKDLLTHSTGYENQMFSEKHLTNINKNEVLNYGLNYEIPYEVGKRFAYNNFEPFLISVLFKEGFNINLSNFVNENIFKKLDISEYKWDNFGKYCIASSGLFLKHSDFHKIGELLLNAGIYKTEQIIPEKWIKEIISLQVPTPDLYNSEKVLPKIGAGYFTFISKNGYIFRDGTNGQYIILSKDQKLLITIMASEKNMQNISEILRDII